MSLQWSGDVLTIGFDKKQIETFEENLSKLGQNCSLCHLSYTQKLPHTDRPTIIFINHYEKLNIVDCIQSIRKTFINPFIVFTFKEKDFDALYNCYLQRVEGVVVGELDLEKMRNTFERMAVFQEKKGLEAGFIPYEQILTLFSSPIKVKDEDQFFNLLREYLNGFEDIQGISLLEYKKDENELKLLRSEGRKLEISKAHKIIESIKLPKKIIGQTFEHLIDDINWVFVPYNYHPESHKFLAISFLENVNRNVLNRYFFLYLENLHLYRHSRTKVDLLTELAHTDEVTGLFNSRKLSEDLKQEIEDYEKAGTPFSIMFIDVDHFKDVNDNFGHIIGSRLLLLIGEMIQTVLRESDKVYRYGGDEFVVVMPNVEASTVYNIALRVLEKIKAHGFDVDQDELYYLTLSIGIGEYPRDAKSAKEIIQFADEMMYRSKKSGRGKVFHVNEVKDASTDY